MKKIVLNPESKEFLRVKDIFNHSVSNNFSKNHPIKKITLIWNKTTQKMFEGRFDILSARSKEPKFQSTWNLESDSQIKKERNRINERLEKYVDKFYPQPENSGNKIIYIIKILFLGVNVCDVWHGTSEENISKICSTGLSSFTTTDSGKR